MNGFLAVLITAAILCGIFMIFYAAFPRRRASPAPREKAPKGPPPKKGIMESIDEMDGIAFEEFCANLLEHFGYQNIHVTKSSGDQGVDIIAIKNGIRYAFQCKRYASKIGNSAVQEVNTGKTLYSCQVGVVITNSYFTAGAKQAAKATGVELWDRDVLMDKIARILH